jgi:DNA ligase-1
MINDKTTLPTLFKRAKTGKVQEWTMHIEGDTYWADYGQQGGKIQSDKPTTAKAKNVGNSNATTPEEQALKEAKAKWEKKLKKDYYESIEAIDEFRFFPTLSEKVQERGGKLFGKPAYVSPKMDGVRCHMTKATGGLSRENNHFPATEPYKENLEALFADFPKFHLDGEMYSHLLKEDFNKIISLIKKQKPTKANLEEIVANMQYHVFDFPFIDDEYNYKVPFEERWLRGLDILARYDLKGLILPVGQVRIDECSLEVIERFHNAYIEQGYEGVMVRSAIAPYEFCRTTNLQKLKNFIDEEFRIIDILEGEGSRSGMLGKFVCMTKEGKEFRTDSRGNFAQFTEWWVNREKYIGQLLTVRYQNLTPDGIPRFTKAVAIRDYE